MARIPLEDTFADIVGKAQRGLGLSDEELARRIGLGPAELARALAGDFDAAVMSRIARALRLGPQALLDSARQAWYPALVTVAGLAQFNTPYAGMHVNAYLAWHPTGREAVVFDTGADCTPMLTFAQAHDLTIKLVLLTHGHQDHVGDLARLKRATGAPAFVGRGERVEGADTFAAGHAFKVGDLRIQTRLTSGHSVGGITYVVHGLSRPVAVVGDALFAGSIGGGVVSYADALANNRAHILSLPDETVLCPGHGPMTSVGEEKQHNPFFPEFQED